MDRREFKDHVGRYRAVMSDRVLPACGLDRSSPGMDWCSDLYLEGYRRFLDVMESYLPVGSRVLDFGCGMGFFATLMSRAGYRVTGVDIDPVTTSRALEEGSCAWGSLRVELENPSFLSDCWEALSGPFEVDFEFYDGRALPGPDDAFRCVIAHAVLEHVPRKDLSSTLEEIGRVLEPEGLFMVFRTPRSSAYLESLARILGRESHELVYGEEELIEKVESRGFRIAQRGVSDMLPSFPPPALMGAYNFLSPVTARLDWFLLGTRLASRAHHMTLVFEKA